MKALPAALAFVFAAVSSIPAWALPEGAQVASGAAVLNQAGNALTITNSANAILNWQKFSISANELVRFQQPSASSIVLNRVVTQNPSAILGQLLSNGHVWLVNPAGILVGAGATIDTAGFVASTLNISNADFLAGRLLFSKDVATPGSLVNQGIITTSSGGSVYLIGTNVTNAGVITTPQGESILAAGQTVSLVDTATPGVKVNITGDGATTNLGSILSEAGRIGIAGGLVRNQGLISSSSVVSQGGRVFIKAGQRAEIGGTISAQGAGGGTISVLADMQNGTVNVAGRLDASAINIPSPLAGEGQGEGYNGGFIETSAAHVQVADTAHITTAAPNGKTGTWLIDPNDYTIAASGGDITGSQLSTDLVNNNIIILSAIGATAGSGDINVNDAVSWSANTLTLTAARDININAVMTASGTSALALNPATANGEDAAVAGGTVKAGFNADGSFSGRVDFGARSGAGLLTINGNGYTVINSLGAAGSTTGADLQGMNGNLAGRYALGSNIDATATSGWNGGLGFLPVGDGNAISFTGTLDGLGHTITGLSINRPAADGVALFGSAMGASVRNVGLVGSNVRGHYDVGALAAWYYQGTITNSYSTGSVTGSGRVGGLVGTSQLSAITNSYSTGSVASSSVNDRYVGGLVGYNNGTITRSYATGAVMATNRLGTGGLAGYNDGTIANSYSTGSVSGTDQVGGLVGYNNFGAITNSYSAGAVTGTTNVGGLVGMTNTTFTSAYWDTQTSGQSNCGGTNGSIAGCTGQTTAQMKQQASFSGWDFTNTWRIDEGVAYPTLRAFWVPPPPSNTWLGLLDSYWTTVGNWSFGHVPTATEIVTIPDVADTAFVEMGGGPFTVKNITSAEPFKLTGSGTTFTLTQGGTFNSGLDLAAGTSLTSQGTLNLSSYTLGSGAKINLTQSGTGILTIGGLTYTVINSLGAAGSVTGTDLQGIRRSLAGYYALGSNIVDASTTSGWSSGAGFTPIGDGNTYFTGTFDGLGHTISGLVINRPGTNYVGLFGAANGAAIRNVGLVGGSVSGQYSVGGLVGLNPSGTISNSYATGSVSGYYGVGGLVGYNTGTITNSYSTGNVISSSSNVGGLVGNNSGGTIINSYATGTVDGGSSLAGFSTAGGLVGDNSGGAISNSYATGIVTGTGDYVGGLVGKDYSGSTIDNSYSSGSVTGRGSVGGLEGLNYGVITNSYSTGSVTGRSSNVGGLVGLNYGDITNSYVTGTVTGTTSVGGLVGKNNSGTIANSYWDTQTSGQPTSAGGAGKTTAEMKQLATFIGWDFTNTWRIDEGVSYPTLRVFWSGPASFFWDNESGDFLWTNPLNWNLNSGLPGSADSVTLNLIGGSEARLTTGIYSIGSLTCSANNGLLINGGSLTILGAANLAGDVKVQSGTLALKGAASSVGTLHLSGTGTLDLAGALSATTFNWTGVDNDNTSGLTPVGTTVKGNGTGSLTVSGSINMPAPVTAGGIWWNHRFLDGAVLNANGTGADNATLGSGTGGGNGAAITLLNGSTINNGGNWILNYANIGSGAGNNVFNNLDSGIFSTPGGAGGGTLSVPFNNSGTVSLNGGAGGLNLAGGGTSSGSISTTAGTSLAFTGSSFGWSGGSLSGTGTVDATALTLTGSGARVLNGPSISLGATTIPGGSIEVQSGTLNLGGASTIAVGANLIATGGAVNAASTLDVAGTLTAGAGSVSATGITIAATGLLTGIGAVTAGAVTNNGVIAPGTAATTGTLTVNGNLAFGAGSSLDARIGGAAAGQYDVLAVSGATTLNGTLNATTTGGFTPNGEPFPVLTYGSRTGTFTTLNLPANFSNTFNAADLTLTHLTAPTSLFWDNDFGDFLWATATNWSLNRLPVSADNVTLNVSGGSEARVTTGTHSIASLISSANNSLLINGGSLTVLGAATLSGNVTLQSGGLTLGGASTLANYAQSGGAYSGAGDVTVSNSFSHSGGTFNSTGNVSITQAAGSLTLTQPISAASLQINVPGSSLVESGAGAITANSLTTTSYTGQMLNGANAVGTFSASNSRSGSIAFANTAATLTIAAIAQASAGSITVNNTGALDVTGLVSAASGPINLTAGGTLSLSGSGAISTPGLLTTSSVDGLNLNGPNAVGNLNATNTAGGDIVFNNSGALTIAGIQQSGGGNVIVGASGMLTVQGDVTAADPGDVTLYAFNVEDITGGSGTITARNLTLSTNGAINRVNTNTTGLITLTAYGAGLAGGIYIAEANSLKTSRINVTTNPTSSQTVVLTSNRAITVDADIGIATDDLYLYALGGDIIGGAGTATATKLSLQATGGVGIGSAVKTNTTGTLDLASYGPTAAGNISVEEANALVTSRVVLTTDASAQTVRLSAPSITTDQDIGDSVDNLTLIARAGNIEGGAGLLTASALALDAAGFTGTVGTKTTGRLSLTTHAAGAAGNISILESNPLATSRVRLTTSSSGSHPVVLATQGPLTLDADIGDAADDLYLFASGGDMIGGLGAAIAKNLTLGAMGQIGPTFPVATSTTGTLTLETNGVGAAGNIYVTELNALDTNRIVLSTDATSTQSVLLAAPSITVGGDIGNALDDLNLQAGAGNIVGGGGTITADNLWLLAVDGGIGIGSRVNTNTGNQLSLTTTGIGTAGNISVNEWNPLGLRTSKVFVTTDSTAQAVQLISEAFITVDGNIGNSVDDLVLRATTGDILGGAGTATATRLSLRAAGGIGLAAPVKTNTTGVLELVSYGANTAGNISVEEANALDISRLVLSTDAASAQTVRLSSPSTSVTANFGDPLDDLVFAGSSTISAGLTGTGRLINDVNSTMTFSPISATTPLTVSRAMVNRGTAGMTAFGLDLAGGLTNEAGASFTTRSTSYGLSMGVTGFKGNVTNAGTFVAGGFTTGNTISNTGTLQLAGYNENFRVDNQAGGTLNAGGTVSGAIITAQAGSAVNGSLVMESGSTLTLNTASSALGTLDLKNSGVTLNAANGRIANSVRVMSGGSIYMGPARISINAATVRAADSINLGGDGVLNMNANATIGGLTMSGYRSTVGGTGDLSLTGASTLSDGTLSGTGKLINEATGTLTFSPISSTAPITVSRAMVNRGTAGMTAFGLDLAGGLSNEAGASFTTLSASGPVTMGVTRFKGNVTNAGTFVAGGFTVGNTISNTGTLQLAGYNEDFRVDNQAGGTLNAGGTVSNARITVQAGSTLNGSSLTMESGSSLTLNIANAALGSLDLKKSSVTLNAANGRIANNVKVLSGSGSLLDVSRINIDAATTRAADSINLAALGVLNVNANATIGGLAMNGSISSVAGSGDLSLTGASTISDGTLSGTGKLVNGATGTLTFSPVSATAPITVSRAMVNRGVAGMTAFGLDLAGGLSNEAGASFTTLSASGPVTMGVTRFKGNVTNAGAFVAGGFTTGNTISNTGTLQLSGTNAGFRVDNQAGGTLNAGGTVSNAMIAVQAGSTLNGSSLTMESGSSLTLNIANAALGSLDLKKSSVTLNAANGRIANNVRVLPGSGSILDVSRINIDAATTRAADSINLAALGVLNANANATIGGLTMSGYRSTVGGAGDLSLTGASTLSDGTLSGTGKLINEATGTLTFSPVSGTPLTVDRPVVNRGTLEASTGSTTFNGSFTNVAGAIFVVDARSTSDYGKMAVGGTANLDGTFKLVQATPFMADGSTMTMMTYGTRSGSFATVNLPAKYSSSYLADRLDVTSPNLIAANIGTLAANQIVQDLPTLQSLAAPSASASGTSSAASLASATISAIIELNPPAAGVAATGGTAPAADTAGTATCLKGKKAVPC